MSKCNNAWVGLNFTFIGEREGDDRTTQEHCVGYKFLFSVTIKMLWIN